ncbi:chemotaxis protein CheC [Sinanaerobacter chloroacetimidivorans]|jgi:chemotaxis protein CheC|uniref:Chemotaxis protein CheC n=1 Tax=Sinanaerobacter chloroacetimidivorans TaxID=2818044 RepID=A0A8J7W1U2_9FIRM|nr:chemotaxis protein CheC [Sinanaerobacter chloroacetimidivorans]MBR0597556.1 chemotaxis protein CheC [Sinanaerobacter chloroacetimidivorans]
MLKNYDELNDIHIDVLREIGNIGAGNAASALATILDERVDISLPRVRITDFDTAINALGGAETMTVGVLVNFSGEANGMIMFLLNMEDAKNIMDILVGDTEDDDNLLSELKLSAIKEIGNILGSSYINSISTLTGLVINISIPYIAIDMAGALMSVPIIEFGSVGDKVMFIEESFSAEENHLKSNIIMFAEIETLKIIMERLGLDI